MPEITLDALQREHPRWSMWWGEKSQRYLAAPLREDLSSVLIEAKTLTQLRAAVRMAENTYYQ